MVYRFIVYCYQTNWVCPLEALMKAEQDNVERIIERMYAEWRRGMLSYWVLGMLLLKPMYGLEIKEQIKEKTQGKMNLHAAWLGLAAFVSIGGLLTLLIFIGEAVRDALDPRKTFR